MESLATIERAELAKMPQNELEAYARILKMSARCIMSREDRALNLRHQCHVTAILRERSELTTRA